VKYAIHLTNRFRRSFRKLPEGVKERIRAAVEELAARPYSGRFITTMRVWSYRVGDYRILYSINEDERRLVLLTVRHRRKAYR